MYIIITYDSPDSNKFHKIIKKYLFWNQNSVFHGEITNTNFKKLENELKEILNENDSLTIFSNMIHDFLIYKYGKEKGFNDNFI